MNFVPDRPYNELPDLPPAPEVETKEVLRRCIAAHSALAELRVAGKLIPNQAMLINSIPLLEAQASSEIENVVTNTDLLFRFANGADGQADPATKETLRYRNAIFLALDMLKQQQLPVSTIMATEVCRMIKDADLDIRTKAGTTLRKGVTGEIIYTPPNGEDLIRAKLANWESYISQDDLIDPLIRLAIMHYQFEAIHPFLDGNGRTGRALNLIYLVQNNLLETPVILLSRYINDNREHYYRYLLEVTTQQAWQQWILFMLDALTIAADWTRTVIYKIRELLEDTVAKIRHRLPKTNVGALADLIFVHPYCRIGNVISAGIAKRQTASFYLNALAEVGMLAKTKVGRENFFINSALFQHFDRARITL